MPVVAQHHVHHGPGDHDGSRTNDGDKVQHGQSKGQQQKVGLTDQKEAPQQNEEYTDG